MKKMLIIKDFKDWFWATFPTWEEPVSLDVGYMREYFEKLGYEVEITSYSQFDYSKNYSGYIVLYGSAEDYCGGTKTFIEDVVLYLDKQGAILLPAFEYFRAHDNKVMMEILRKGFRDEKLKSIHSDVWASYEEFCTNEISEFPVVVKRAGGAGGTGVFLAHNKEELYKCAEKVSRMTDSLQFYYLSCKNIKRKLYKRRLELIHNNKFITQNYISGLDGDYKVLVFGQHYFVLHRLNRKDDFRASGSGQFTSDNTEHIYEILDFAKACTQEIISPWLSLDICHDGVKCHLIEFQCLTFGFKAMSMSEMHYVCEDGKWKTVQGKVIPEEEFCYSVRYFLENC